MSRCLYALHVSGRAVSYHRTLRALVLAERRIQRECRAANGFNTWRETALRRDDGSHVGEPLTRDERETVCEIRRELDDAADGAAWGRP